ncbi:adrenocortical dysplasia protein homolog isoform X2 [Engraulis encrasicolus]|uniref:adrenocortical dysplasia protein homolog isoform X2 n=1 Tax=Engraulis encrasicolus TaxID=184585 RepID=UPI002FD6EC33
MGWSSSPQCSPKEPGRDCRSDMEERERFSGLTDAIVSAKSLQLNFHLEPELANCQFYVTVNQMSTTGQASNHNAVPNCATLASVKDLILKLWSSRLEETSSQSQYGFRLTELLEEWANLNTQPDMIDSQAALSQPTTSRLFVNTPPAPPTTSRQIGGSSAESSTSHQPEAPPATTQSPPLLEEEEEEREAADVHWLRGIMRRLASQSCDRLVTPTRWDQDRLAYKVEEGFSIPAHHLLIPENQGGVSAMPTTSTSASASTSSSTPSDLVGTPRDAQAAQPTPPQDPSSDQPGTTQRDVRDQLPSSGERTDDSPPCSGVLAEAEQSREGGAWDIFGPVVDMLRSPSSSEISATPEDLPVHQSQSAVVIPENLPLFQSQSDSATPDNLPLTKIQSDSVTPENLCSAISEPGAATPRKMLPRPLGYTALDPPENLEHSDSQSGSTGSTDNFPFHQSLLARLSPKPIGTSTQIVSSNGSSGQGTGSTLPPYQAPLPSGLSPAPLSGKRCTPEAEEEEEDEDGKAARSPPSWIAQTQQKQTQTQQREAKKRMILSPSKQTWVHSDGSAFANKYEVSVKDMCALGNFKVSAEDLDWAMCYLLAPPQPSAPPR